MSIGITEFYTGKNKMSIGVSYEDIDEEKNVYIYNIFCGDEYINISNHGRYGDRLPDAVVNELTERWNELIRKG